MSEQTITVQDAARKIFENGGKIFSVGFWPKAKPTFRKMVARRFVEKFTKGGEMGYDPAEHEVIPVAEFVFERDSIPHRRRQLMPNVRTTNIQYRNININGIRQLTIGGCRYNVVDPAMPSKVG
jgi:hypothetical protein